MRARAPFGNSLHRAARLLVSWLLAALSATALAEPQTATWPGTVQAVHSDWSASQPPDSGWVDVSLPDDWGRRWPNFDGVVWYRLTWNEAAPLQERGVVVEYLSMAGAISVNGELLERDASLVEPLSRSWNAPRYLLLTPPLLREGENAALFRISGFAVDQPGLGPVHIGTVAETRIAFERERWLRQRLNLVSLAIGSTLGVFFIVLWLMRRRESAYGWYGAQQLAWFPSAWNVIAGSTWPFHDTDTYAAIVTASMMTYCTCYAMFVLRFFERRMPRLETALWIATAIVCLWMFATPHADRGRVRDALTALAALSVLTTNTAFLWMAWRGGRVDQRVLSICALLACIAGVHDALLIIRVIDGNIYYATLTEHITVIGVALVLAWNFVRNLRRIEGFNAELQHSVGEARAELAATLTRQHDLELVHARLGERVSLAHDLHDGLGGMLIGNIARLEQAPAQMSSRAALGMLQELRDDLRLIVDTAAAQHYGEHSLAELLAPLRHRMTRLFEAHDIAVRWRVENLEEVYLNTTQSLDVLRILQEALTNVLKHANASRVDVILRNETNELLLEVRDNGRGLVVDIEAHGTGMRSMQARARRLDATLSVSAESGTTLVRLSRPWPV